MVLCERRKIIVDKYLQIAASLCFVKLYFHECDFNENETSTRIV